MRFTSPQYRRNATLVNDVEMLYLMTFVPAAFLQPAVRREALHGVPRAVPHEPVVRRRSSPPSGALRPALRLEGRKRSEHRIPNTATRKGHDRPELFEFLRYRYRDLWLKHGGIRGVVVPAPATLAVGPRAAAGGQGKLRFCLETEIAYNSIAAPRGAGL